MNIAGVKGEQDWEAVYDINLVRCYSSCQNSSSPRKASTLASRQPGLGCPRRRVDKEEELCLCPPPVVSPARFDQFLEDLHCQPLSTVAQGDMYATPAYTASKHAVTALTRTMGVNKHCDRRYSIYVALIVFLLSFSTSSGWKGRVFLSWLLRLTT